MAARPFPGDLVAVRRPVEPLPELMIGFAFKFTVHCAYEILRIRDESHSTGLAQSLKADASSHYLRLLVRERPQILADNLISAVIFQDGNSSSTGLCEPIAQTATIAYYADLLHIRPFFNLNYSQRPLNKSTTLAEPFC